MKLKELAAKPQLIELTINDDSTVENYGEPIQFWIYDRQSMSTYMRLAQLDFSNSDELVNLFKTLILDEAGMPIVEDDAQLPPDLMMKAVESVILALGNSKSQTSVK